MYFVFPWVHDTTAAQQIADQPVDVKRAAWLERSRRLVEIKFKLRQAGWRSWVSVAGIVFRPPANYDFTGCELDERGSPVKAKLREMGIEEPCRRIRDSKEKYPLSFRSVIYRMAGFFPGDEALLGPTNMIAPAPGAPAEEVDRMKVVQCYQDSRQYIDPCLKIIASDVMVALKSPDRRERESSIAYLQVNAFPEIVEAVGDELAWQACSLDPTVYRKARALIRIIGPKRLDALNFEEDDLDEDDLDEDDLDEGAVGPEPQ